MMCGKAKGSRTIMDYIAVLALSHPEALPASRQRVSRNRQQVHDIDTVRNAELRILSAAARPIPPGRVYAQVRYWDLHCQKYYR